MKVAILGTRGIPANYGGFETFAEELSVRLAARGRQVTVYGRSNNVRYPGRKYRGVDLVILPTIGTKYLDTVAHTLLCVLHAVFRRFDCILMCNAANAVFAAIPRITGTPVALNVDGIERKRKKWGIVGRSYYRISEYLSTVFPHVMVTDAEVIRDYYLERYRARSVMIAYDTPENREAVGDCGLFFRTADDLTRQIQSAIDDPAMVEQLRHMAQTRARVLYSWDAVTDRYEKLFIEMTASGVQ